jgi:hypothetical protein
MAHHVQMPVDAWLTLENNHMLMQEDPYVAQEDAHSLTYPGVVS